MKKILVPVDFSSATAPTVAVAEHLARALSGELILLHVAQPEPEFIGYEPGPSSVRDAVARQFVEEHKRIHELDRSIEREGFKVTSLVVQGYTVDKILQEIGRLGAELVVMGSHGHGKLAHLLTGSVTEGVLRKSPCPVVVVPTRQRG